VREEPENDFLAHKPSLGGRESPDVKMHEPCEPPTEERDEHLIGVLIHLCVHLNQKYIKYSQLHQHIPPLFKQGYQTANKWCDGYTAKQSEAMHTAVNVHNRCKTK
jgi:hypothetical protein